MERRFSSKENFRIVLLPVEASIPRPGPDPETATEQETLGPGEDSKTDVGRIHREELYADIQDMTKFSKVHIVMVILSLVLAAIGILKNNVALSLATTLGHTSLGRMAGRMALNTNITGVLIVFIISAQSRTAWKQVASRYMIEEAAVEPTVTMTANENWMEFTLRYIVDYKKRRSIKDQLFSRIFEAFDKTDGSVKVASTSMAIDLVHTPLFDVRLSSKTKSPERLGKKE